MAQSHDEYVRRINRVIEHLRSKLNQTFRLEELWQKLLVFLNSISIEFLVRLRGKIMLVATAWDYLAGGWLVKSEYEPDHAPGFEIF